MRYLRFGQLNEFDAANERLGPAQRWPYCEIRMNGQFQICIPVGFKRTVCADGLPTKFPICSRSLFLVLSLLFPSEV